MKIGTYGFEKATITNIITNEAVEKSFDDILNDQNEYLHWGWLLSFSVDIKQDTESVFKSDNRYFMLNEGIAYELSSYNTLKLHLPRWEGYDYELYDVVITLVWQKLYG